jgi:hypothetical protein
MAITWEALAEKTGAEMVGGHLILKRGAERVVLGVKRGPQFDLSPEGDALATELDEAERAAAIEEATRPKRARKAGAKGAPGADPETADVVDPENDGNPEADDPDAATDDTDVSKLLEA